MSVRESGELSAVDVAYILSCNYEVAGDSYVWGVLYCNDHWGR